MYINLAGQITIERDGTVVDESALGGPQAATAFAFLVAERERLVARDELADVLWGEQVPDTWTTALRGVVQRVRRFLAQVDLVPTEALRTAFGCYQLVVPDLVIVDLEASATALDDAERALADGDASRARELAVDARAVASRGFLPGHSGLWVEARQAWLRNMLTRSLGLVAETQLALGNPLLARETVEELLLLEPLREAAYLTLMRAHDQAGNRAEAIRAYERCHSVLADELGVEPGIEVQQAFAMLLGDGGALPSIAGAMSQRVLPWPLRPAARDPALVGRAAERAPLEAAWNDVLDGEYRIAVVSGEPGIGKTRLAREIAAEAFANGATVLYGRADADVGGAYRPFIEAIDGFATSASSSVKARIAPITAELNSLIQGTRDRDATSADTDRHHLFELVASALSIASTDAPTLVVLDDLHWADAATLSMLRHVAHSTPARGLMLLAVHRDTEAQDPGALADTLGVLAALPHTDIIRLQGLTFDEAAALVADVRDEDSTDIAEGIWRDAGGNPFFVSEVARVIDATTTPKVQHVIQHRVGQLPLPGPDVLALAATAGPEFDLATIVAASDLDEDAVLNAIDAAERARLLTRLADQPGRLAFAHDLVRSTIYGSLAPAIAMRFHRRLGWVVESEPPRSRDRRSRLAHHFVLAAPLGDWRRAVLACIDAAEEAVGALVFEAAVTHCDQGLEVLSHAGDPSGELRCDLESIRAASLRLVTDPGAFDALWQAAATARALGDATRLARIALSFSPEGGSSNAALLDRDLIALYEETLVGLNRAPGDVDALRAQVLGALATELAWSPTPERAVVARQQAVELARRSDDARALAQVLITTRHSLTGSGSIEELYALEAELLALGERLDDPAVLARACTWRFETSITAGDGATAREALERAEHFAGALPNQTYTYITAFSRVGLALIDGNIDGAERSLSDVEAAGVRAGIQPVIRRAVALTLLTLIRFEQHRLDEIEPEAAEALSVGVPAWDAVLAFAHAHLKRNDDAMDDVDRALAPGGVDALLRGLGGLGCSVALGQALARIGEPDRAEIVYSALRPYAGRGAFTLVFFGPVDHALGALAVVLERPDDARTHLREAVDFCDRLGAPRWRERCAADLAALT